MTVFRVVLIALVSSVLGSAAALAQSASLFPGLGGGGNNDTPVEVEADSLELTETATDRVAVLNGSVVVTRGATVIRASTITLYSTIEPAAPATPAAAATPAATPATPAQTAGMAGFGSESLRRIEANGGVTIVSTEQQATGNSATFDMVTQLVTLTGNVRLAQGPNVITGERLVVDLAAGTARVEQGAGGRIRGTFLPGPAAP